MVDRVNLVDEVDRVHTSQGGILIVKIYPEVCKYATILLDVVSGTVTEAVMDPEERNYLHNIIADVASVVGIDWEGWNLQLYTKL